MKLLQRLPLTVLTPTFASPGQSRILLDRIPAIRRVAGGTTYLRRIVLVWRGTYTADAGAGNQTLNENHAHDIIDQLYVRLNGRSWPIYDLPNRAGSLLQKYLHFSKGRRPRASGGTVNGAGGGSITVAEAGTTVRLVLELPFYNPWGIEPDDWGIPLALLQNQCEIIVHYAANANAGLFGAGMDGGGNVTGTLEAYADLIERDEFRIPQFFSLQAVNLSSLQDQLPVAGRVLHMVLETPVNADGLTDAVITDANRVQINHVKIDGHDVTQNMAARNMLLDWIMSFPRGRAEEVLDLEDNLAPFLPWFFPLQDFVKVTSLPICVGQPQFSVTGTSATPRVLVLTTELNLAQTVMEEVRRSQVTVPAGFARDPEAFISAKVAGKGFVRAGTDVALRMPLKINPQPVRPPGSGLAA